MPRSSTSLLPADCCHVPKSRHQRDAARSSEDASGIEHYWRAITSFGKEPDAPCFVAEDSVGAVGIVGRYGDDHANTAIERAKHFM